MINIDWKWITPLVLAVLVGGSWVYLSPTDKYDTCVSSGVYGDWYNITETVNAGFTLEGVGKYRCDPEGKELWCGRVSGTRCYYILEEGIIPQDMAQHSNTWDRQCNDGRCNLVLYPGIRNVFEEGKWVRLENSTGSLKEYFNVVYLDKEEGLDIEVKDFGYNWINFEYTVTDEKQLRQMIPIKVDGVEVKRFLWNNIGDKRTWTVESDNILDHTYSFGKTSTSVNISYFFPGCIIGYYDSYYRDHFTIMTWDISSLDSVTLESATLHLKLYDNYTIDEYDDGDTTIYRVDYQSGPVCNLEPESIKSLIDNPTNTTGLASCQGGSCDTWLEVNATTSVGADLAVNNDNFTLWLEDPDYGIIHTFNFNSSAAGGVYDGNREHSYREYYSQGADIPYLTIVYSSGAAGDTCDCPGSGDWEMDCTDNCVLSEACDLQTNNFKGTGSGTFKLNADITNYGFYYFGSGCNFECDGGCFI